MFRHQRQSSLFYHYLIPSRKLLLFCVFLLSFIGRAQTPSFNFQKLGSEEGLNNASIFNIEQHENGLIYLTTQNGIYYYDGYNFRQLRIDSLKSNALINASIKNREELLLSLRDEGVASFNLRTGDMRFAPSLQIKDNNADNVILTDRVAYLLISRIKLVMVDLKSGKVVEDQLKKQENLAFCIYKTNEGRILLGRSDGLYDVSNGRQEKLELLKDRPVFSLAQDKQGRLLAGTLGKILVVNGDRIESEIEPVYKTKSSTFLPDGATSINKIITDDFGRIWFTSYPEETLFLYENNTVHDVFQLLDLPPSLIKCVFKDRNQNLWIGTNNDGVYYIQNAFFHSINFAYNSKVLNVNQVYLKNNLLVAATSNGLYGLNLRNNQTKALSKPDEVFLEPIFNISEREDVIYYTKRNELNVFPTIFIASGITYKFKPVIASIFYPLDAEHSVVADWDLNILLANADGSKATDTLIAFTDYRIKVNALLKRDNILYIGTSNGLFTYDFKTRKQRNLVSPELNYNINDLALVNKKLYAAHEGGITDIDAKVLTQQIGNFRLNSVKKIKQFSDQIWLATLNGVLVCNSDLQPLKILDKSNGLLSNSVNDISFSGQTVGFGTARGVSFALIKDIIRYSARMKAVTIDRLYTARDTIEISGSTYRLKPEDDNVSVSFYSPLFNRPHKQLFRFRINEGEWKYINNMSFDMNLPGGNHVVEISASADNIEWSEVTRIELEKEEKLSEKQALYWLITLGGLALIVLISFFWVRRIKIKGKKRLQEEQQVNLLKHQAMNSLLSPHFIFNSLTSIQNYINTNNGLRASEYLAKFSRLIRMIIEKAAQSQISLHDELARLTYYLELEKERFKNKFDYAIHIDENINTHEIQIPNMIIQPYVENCIIHGILPKQEHGELSLTFTRMPDRKFVITIEDNGIGLIKAREHAKTGHKSLGTSTIQNILEINQKLSGKKQKVSMTDKSTLDPLANGTIIQIELEL